MRLRSGDTVAVVAPASPVPDDLLRRGVALLEGWGLRVRVGDHVLDRHPRLDYLAGADADRAADLQRAWCDPDVAAVFCARGGYGCLRLLDVLDVSALRRADPPLLVGSSDVTVLHHVIGGRLGVATLYAPMIGTTALHDDSVATGNLRTALFRPEHAVTVGRGHDPIRSGTTHGTLVGGNLSLLASLPAPPQAGPKVLALEDVDEDPYRIDHLVTAMLSADWFTGVTGVALGSWQGCGPLAAVRAVLADRLAPLGVPVAWEVGFGHCAEALPIPLGVGVVLDADSGTVTVDPSIQAAVTTGSPSGRVRRKARQRRYWP